MATTFNNAVQQLYVAYFNRPADPAGLTFWSNAISSANGSTAAVAAAFSTSGEYTAEYAGMTNTQIVNQVYQNLFGRSTTGDAGADFWITGLNNKTITVADVVTAVAAGAQGTDLTAFNNKVTAAGAFTTALDTDAEKAGYVGTDANDIAKDFLAGVTTNATLAAAILPENLNKVVAESVAAGTEFTVVGGLQSLEAAIDARADYLVSITDEDATATATDASVATDLTDAQDDFGDVFGAQNSAAYTIYSSTTTSTTVKTALINDQIAANAKDLSDAQKELATATADVAEVKGLQSAIDKLTAAEAAQKTAASAVTAADADVKAKEASFEFLSAAKITTGYTATYNADGTVTLVKPEDTTAGTPADTKTLIKLDADGALVLNDSTVTEKAYPGITALLNSITADQAAHTASTNAGIVVTTAQTNLTTLGHADLVTAQSTASDAVDTAETAISDFNDALAALNVAQQHSDTLAGYQATVDAAVELFSANDFNLVNIDDGFTTGTVSEVATAESDVFVVGEHNATINLFGLQGSDSLYIGEGYTVNTGKLSTGDNAKLEVFISQSGANTILQVETSTFGSSAATPEVVKITLVGVTSTDVHLDANGLITVA
jgi:hypothetical protein